MARSPRLWGFGDEFSSIFSIDLGYKGSEADTFSASFKSRKDTSFWFGEDVVERTWLQWNIIIIIFGGLDGKVGGVGGGFSQQDCGDFW